MAYETMISLDMKQFDQLVEAIKDYGENAEEVINEILWYDGAETIRQEIHKLLPESGRTWKGKKAAAKSTQPFHDLQGNLSVTVVTKPAYGYLYFPDDGTNTRKHAGNQQFMKRGAEAATPAILEMCLAELVEDF